MIRGEMGVNDEKLMPESGGWDRPIKPGLEIYRAAGRQEVARGTGCCEGDN